MLLRPLLVSALLLVALPARAERPHDAVTLEYLPSRATVALCPEADFLAFQVRLRLEYELVQPTAPNHLAVKIDRANGRFRSIGEIRDDDGNVTFTRTHSEIDCTMAVVSMAISVSIHFTRAPEPPEAPPAATPEPTEPPLPAPPAPEPSPPVAPAPLPEPRRYQAGLASVFSTGTAPTIVGGVSGFLGVRWSSVALALEGRALFAPSATIEQATVRDGYRFTYTALSGSGCYQPGWFFACARAEVGSLSFGNATVRLDRTHMIILGLGARFGGDVRLTPWLALRTYVELLGQPLSGALTSDAEKSGSVWIQTGFSGSIGLGPVFTFSGI
jgi:hypothetical protein